MVLVLLGGLAGAAAGCSSDDGGTSKSAHTEDYGGGAPDADIGDAPLPDTDANRECDRKDQAYHDFIDGHRACTTDADCAVVGDCGPNVFVSVQKDAAAHATELMEDRCSGDGVFDGPVYDAVCTEGTCGLRERTDTCCGCAPIQS